MKIARGLAACAAGFALFTAADAALFHSPLYRSFLDPASSTGSFEFVAEAERTRAVDGPNQILAIGDSRMALRAWQANELGAGYTFGSAGVSSSTPRVWHYLLRAIDPGRDRYAAILFLVDDYDDEDMAEDLGDREFDLRLMAPRIGVADIPALAASYDNWIARGEVLRSTLWKGIVYKQDVQDFLRNPRRRLADIRFQREHWREALRGFRGAGTDLRGLAIDWSRMEASFPERFTEEQRRAVRDYLLRPAMPQTGRKGAYRREWFGRILARYRGSRTRFVFCRAPRGPFVRPDSLVRKRSASVRELAAHPQVRLLDEHLLDELERPEFFMDPLHLNAEGARRLTVALARRVADAL